jgi:transcriptional regulator with XRE-family HTH domain
LDKKVYKLTSKKEVGLIDKIGAKIKLLRQQKQWTQRQLAEKFGLGKAATEISRWERDVVQPSAAARKQMAAIFKVSVKFFYP